MFIFRFIYQTSIGLEKVDIILGKFEESWILLGPWREPAILKESFQYVMKIVACHRPGHLAAWAGAGTTPFGSGIQVTRLARITDKLTPLKQFCRVAFQFGGGEKLIFKNQNNVAALDLGLTALNRTITYCTPTPSISSPVTVPVSYH